MKAFSHVRYLLGTALLGTCQAAFPVSPQLYRGDDVFGDFVLNGEKVRHVAIVAFGPDMAAGLGVDELARHAKPVTEAPHAAFKHVVDAELSRHCALV